MASRMTVERRLDYATMVLRALASSPTLPAHNRIMVRDALAQLDRWETDSSDDADPNATDPLGPEETMP